MPTPPRVPARYFALLCEAMTDAGCDVERALAAAMIRPSALHALNGTLTLAQVDALLEHAAIVAGRSDIGFEWGRRIKISAHEIVGFAILTSPTMNHALRLAARYYQLILPTFRMSCLPAGSRVEVHFVPIHPLSPWSLLIHMEAIAVSMNEQLKSQLGAAMPSYDIHLSCSQPAHFRRYRELKPARWHFDAPDPPGVRISIDAAALNAPLAMADRSALRMAESQCETLLQRSVHHGGIARWVTMMLREARDDMPTVAELAYILHLTPRGLDRRLRAEGLRFSDLFKRVRHERACELLRGGQTVTHTALQLGYRDVANFSRAFKREAGISPSRFVATEAPMPRRAARIRA